ncbi:hypothetical protein EV715DRAFT_291934 [Schizophyllum commune]
MTPLSSWECGDDSAVRISERKTKTPLSFKELNRMPASVGGIMKHRGDCRRTGINGAHVPPRIFACGESEFMVELRSSRVVEPHVPRGLSGSEEACVYILGRVSGGRQFSAPPPSTPSRCPSLSPLPAFDAVSLRLLDGQLRLLNKLVERSRTKSALRSASTCTHRVPNKPSVCGAPNSRRVGVVARGGAERRCVGGALDGENNRKSTSNAPRSAREVLVDMRDCRGGGGAARRARLLVLPRTTSVSCARTAQASRMTASTISNLTISEANGSLSGEQGIHHLPLAAALPSLSPSLPFRHYLMLSLRLPPPSGDEYMYRRPPSEGLSPSHPRGAPD